MKTVRITGKTVESAVEEGLKQLGVSKEEVVVTVVEQPSGGLLGLFGKKAVVELALKDGEEHSDATAEEDEKAAEQTGESAEKESDAESDAATTEEEAFSEEEQAQVAEAGKTFLEGIFKSMGLHVTMEKMVSRERILFNLHGEGLGVLIGKRGQTLDALQYLTNLAAGKDVKRHYFILLDVENYRDRRRQTLESLAHRLAGKVKRTGESAQLEPMSAGERRIIHLALQEDGQVRTESVGETPHRYVVIRAR